MSSSGGFRRAVVLLAFVLCVILEPVVSKETSAQDLLAQVKRETGDPAAVELERLREEDEDESANNSPFHGYATPRLFFEQMLTMHCEGGNAKQYHAHVDSGINVDARNDEDGETCLIKAARQGHLTLVIDAIDEEGADINAHGFDNTTALIAASGSGNLDVVRHLLKTSSSSGTRRVREKGKISSRKRTEKIVHPQIAFRHTSPSLHSAIMAAAMSEEDDAPKIIRRLALAGSPYLDFQRSDGIAPIHVAALSGQAQVLRALARAGCNLNARAGPVNDNDTEGGNSDDGNSNSNAHAARRFRPEERRRREISRYVKRRDTALQIALEKRNKEVIDYLLFTASTDRQRSKDKMLANGHQVDHRDFSALDVNIGDTHGVTPLMVAAVNGNVTVVERLLELGASYTTESGIKYGFDFENQGDDAAAGVAAATNTLELYASYSFGDYEQ